MNDIIALDRIRGPHALAIGTPRYASGFSETLHSQRNASIGFTFKARRAGSNEASPPTTASNSTVPTLTDGIKIAQAVDILPQYSGEQRRQHETRCHGNTERYKEIGHHALNHPG